MNLSTKIDNLAKAERITKVLLGELSRELLVDYIEKDCNILLINKLLGCDEGGKFVLTPFNWRLACKYFRDFIPHKSNWDTVKEAVLKGGPRTPLMFEGKSGNRAKKIGAKLDAWLSEETNTIWNYQVEIKPTEVDYAKKITNDIAKALDPEKGGLSMIEVLTAVFQGGVTTDDMVAVINKVQQQAA